MQKDHFNSLVSQAQKAFKQPYVSQAQKAFKQPYVSQAKKAFKIALSPMQKDHLNNFASQAQKAFKQPRLSDRKITQTALSHRQKDHSNSLVPQANDNSNSVVFKQPDTTERWSFLACSHTMYFRMLIVIFRSVITPCIAVRQVKAATKGTSSKPLVTTCFL